MTFERPAIVDPGSLGELAHGQLWNPKESGIVIVVSRLLIGASTLGVTILSASRMLATLGFPEPRGLTTFIGGDNIQTHAKGEVRTERTREAIQGAQYVNVEQITAALLLEGDELYRIDEGAGLLVRGHFPGRRLFASFRWREEKRA